MRFSLLLASASAAALPVLAAPAATGSASASQASLAVFAPAVVSSNSTAAATTANSTAASTNSTSSSTVKPLAVAKVSYAPAGPNAANWKLTGCYNDLYPDSRALNGGYYEDQSGMTIAKCLSYCDSQGQSLCALEYGYQCYAGSSLASGSTQQASPAQLAAGTNGGCTTAAAGNSTQNAGGPNRLLLFTSTIRKTPVNPTIPGQKYLGCFADNQNNRVLPYGASTSTTANMTVEKCVALCNSAGYPISGTQYSSQCFCGAAGTPLGNAVDQSNCGNTCTGNSTEICGGPSFNSVYQATSASALPSSPASIATSNGLTYNLVGCRGDRPDSQGRALTDFYATSDSMTNAKCIQLANASLQRGSYLYTSVQNGNECRAGNTLKYNSTAATCNKPCSGNSTEICGGSNYAQTLYKLAQPGQSSSTTSTSSTSTSTSTSPTSPATPTIAMPAGQTYVGCFPDDVNNRVLSYPASTSSTAKMTVEKCVGLCNGAGYALSGLQYSVECWCGSAGTALGTANAGKCTRTCSGNSTEICGGDSYNSVYQAKSTTQLPSSPASITSNGVTYKLVGCRADRPDSQGRALTGFYATSDSMTNAKCIQLANASLQSGSFLYTSVQNGNECRAGNKLNYNSTAATCNKPCSGNSLEICGGTSYAQTLYKKAT